MYNILVTLQKTAKNIILIFSNIILVYIIRLGCCNQIVT